MKLVEAISIRIRDLLKEKGMSQYAVCKNGGVPPATLSHVINGAKRDVKISTIWDICSTIGVSLEEFFADEIFKDIED